MAKDAASFLQLTREDPAVRQALDVGLLAEALDSSEAEQSLLEVSVKIAKQQGFHFDTADLRQALEADLGLQEIVLVSDEFGDEETVDAAGGAPAGPEPDAVRRAATAMPSTTVAASRIRYSCRSSRAARADRQGVSYSLGLRPGVGYELGDESVTARASLRMARTEAIQHVVQGLAAGGRTRTALVQHAADPVATMRGTALLDRLAGLSWLTYSIHSPDESGPSVTTAVPIAPDPTAGMPSPVFRRVMQITSWICSVPVPGSDVVTEAHGLPEPPSRQTVGFTFS